jgi:hypothetical protein
MKTIEDVIDQITNTTGYDRDIVDKICKHAFQYTVETMKDDKDIYDILFKGLFRFKLKRRFAENKTKEYTIK